MFEEDRQDFAVGVPAHTLARFISHYEIFKRIAGVPGVIVDIGVGAGGSTWAFAAMCEIFARGKRVYGFDTFAGFPAVSLEDGRGNLVGVGKMAFPKVFDGIVLPPRIHLYKGDITSTVPEFVKEHPELKIALLNLDADLYAPTRVALECLEPLVEHGGVIILDEYDLVDVFPGERKAVDEYYTALAGRPPRVNRFPWYNNPSAYLVKGTE